MCRSCPLVKWGGDTQVLSASCAVGESIARWSALAGLGSAPFGDRSARFAKLFTNDFRVVLSVGVDRCGGVSAVSLLVPDRR